MVSARVRPGEDRREGERRRRPDWSERLSLGVDGGGGGGGDSDVSRRVGLSRSDWVMRLDISCRAGVGT